jgi:hypothetical protein
MTIGRDLVFWERHYLEDGRLYCKEGHRCEVNGKPLESPEVVKRLSGWGYMEL